MTHERFSYHVCKNGTVEIFRGGRCVTTLGGSRGAALASELEDADEEYVQYLLQRATGNYKRGNERTPSNRQWLAAKSEPHSREVWGLPHRECPVPV